MLGFLFGRLAWHHLYAEYLGAGQNCRMLCLPPIPIEPFAFDPQVLVVRPGLQTDAESTHRDQRLPRPVFPWAWRASLLAEGHQKWSPWHCSF